MARSLGLPYNADSGMAPRENDQEMRKSFVDATDYTNLAFTITSAQSRFEAEGSPPIRGSTMWFTRRVVRPIESGSYCYPNTIESCHPWKRLLASPPAEGHALAYVSKKMTK